MSNWENDLTFPRGPFPPRRTDGGGVAFTAAPDDFAYAAVATLPPLPTHEPEPEVAVLAEPEPEVVVLAEAPPEKRKKRGLFGRKKPAPQTDRGPAIESIPADEPGPAIVAAQTAPDTAPDTSPVAEAEPAAVVVDESSLEIGGEPVPEPAKSPSRRRFGRKEAAQAEPSERVEEVEESTAPAEKNDVTEVEVAAVSVEVDEVEETTAAAGSDSAASPQTSPETPPEVVNLVESHSTPDSSLVDACLR